LEYDAINAPAQLQTNRRDTSGDRLNFNCRRGDEIVDYRQRRVALGDRARARRQCPTYKTRDASKS
jgi:hypothetical protein